MWAAVVIADTAAFGADLHGVHILAADDPVGPGALADDLDVEWLVIAAHPVLERQADLAASMAAGRVPARNITRLITAHAPLAVVAALSQARAASTHPGRALGLAHALLSATTSAAWTSSVTGLQSPAPTIGAHLRSFLPGRGFLVRHAPDPAVLSPDRFGQIRGDLMLVAEAGVPADLAGRLMVGISGGSRQVVLNSTWSSIYGTATVAQLALVPADPRSLVAPFSHRCRSCGLDLPVALCAFCRIMAEPLVCAVLDEQPQLRVPLVPQRGTGR